MIRNCISTFVALLASMNALAPQAQAQASPWSYSAFSDVVRDVAFDANGIAYVTSGDTVTLIDPARQMAVGNFFPSRTRDSCRSPLSQEVAASQ